MDLIFYIFSILLFKSQFKSNESTKSSKNESAIDLHAPLKVIQSEDGKNYILPSQSPVENIDSNNVFLCPMDKNAIPEETRNKWSIQNYDCLNPASIQEGERCEKSFTFRIIRVDERPDVDVFIFGYDVCDVVVVRDRYFVKSVCLEIYKVYADPKTRQTLHTEHRLISRKWIFPPDFKDYMKELKLTHYTNWLVELPVTYKDQIPKSGLLKPILSIDYLIPQMLIPYGDLEPTNARGANLNYLNIRPQYKRLQAIWNKINQFIWERLYQFKLHRSTKIYTSASNILTHKNEDVKIKAFKDFQINVPYVWWRLITTDDEKALIIVLYNVPLDYTLPEMKFVCDWTDMCRDTGWAEIYTFNREENIYAQCCEATDSNLEYLNFIKRHDIKIQKVLNLNEIRTENVHRRKNSQSGRNSSAENIFQINENTNQVEANERISNVDSVGFTDGRISEVSNPDEKGPFDFVNDEPLTLLKEENGENFIFDRPSQFYIEPSGNESLVQGCPENISNTDCIRVNLSEIAIAKCQRKVQPNITTSGTSCAGRGILYTFQYNVCYKTNMEEDKMEFTETPLIYSVCYNQNDKETIYTAHKILTDALNFTRLDAKIYTKRLQTYGDMENDFKDMAITYEYFLEKGIVPQLLVPLDDIDQDYVRGVNFHYLNIRPQYQRIAVRWNEINDQILKHLFINNLYKDVDIFTGTALQLPNSADPTTPAFELKVEDRFPINMPMIWAKVIVSELKSIVILIYNIPFKHHLKDDELLCERSICTETNWSHIEANETKTFRNVRVQCCPNDNRILSYFRLSHIGRKFNGVFPILGLPRQSITEVPS